MSNYRFILSGGGTGGHIYPAIAIGTGLQAAFPSARFLFVGAKGKMEMEKVPQAGFQIQGLWISGLSRKLSLQLFLFPIKLLLSLCHSFYILSRFKPHLVIGTGGYASAPLLKMAQLMGLPTLIQEQNSYAGVTNKWLSKKANAICVAYPQMESFFPSHSLKLTGNPIRKSICETLPETKVAIAFFDLNPNAPVLLILGGSQGAKRINEFVFSQLSFFKEKGVQLIWQCGSLYYDQYRHLDNEQLRVLDFINEMPMAFAAATMAISRAGAGAVSELMVARVPTIFIPSPNVAEDHQTKNAASVVALKAGYMVKESDLEAQFKTQFERLSELSARKKMQKAMELLAKPKAVEEIILEIKNILKA